MSACPKCGGTSGFHYSVRCWDNRRGYWDTDDDETVEIRVAGQWPRSVVCDDCGKRVKRAPYFELTASKDKS